MGIGAILVVIGLVLALTGRVTLGIVLLVIGLLLGGVRRGRWY